MSSTAAVQGGDTSLGGMKESPSLPRPKSKPWYANRQWWKQASVWISILFSAASLILGAVGEFQVLRSDIQKGLNVASLVINALSVVLSALTSLDWKSAAQIEAELLHHLDSLLVQQPVLAQTPSSPATADGTKSPPTTRTMIHVLSLQAPHEEGGKGGAPLLSGSARKGIPGHGNDGSEPQGKAGMKRRVFSLVGGTGKVEDE